MPSLSGSTVSGTPTRRGRAAAAVAAAALASLSSSSSSSTAISHHHDSTSSSLSSLDDGPTAGPSGSTAGDNSTRPRKRRITALLGSRSRAAAAASSSSSSAAAVKEEEVEEEEQEDEDSAAAAEDSAPPMPAPPPRKSLIVRMGRSSAARRSGAGRRSTAASTPAAIPATPTEDNTDAEIGDETQAQLDANEAEDAEAAEGAGGRGDDDEGGEAGDDDDEDEDDEQGEEEVKMIDIDGTEFPQRGDSLILPNDPAGDTKVDDKGRLKGDRAYKFPVFQCPNRADPERLYVLSIDAARSAGYRDSLYFYRNNKRLLKVTLHMSEKEMLIARGRLSMQLRTRNVTATSVLNVYKTHGARVIKAGRAVTDDYYESAARAAGRREGERVRAEGGRERFGGDAELFSGGAGGPVGSLGAGGDYDPSGFAFGPSSTLASIRNKRVDSNVHSFPDPSTGQPVLTVFGDAGLSPWVRIEEGPRAGQTMRRKMLSNMDIDAENWMREAAYMVIGMNRELEDGRKERMTRLLPNGTVRTLTEEGHLLKARMLEEEEDRVAHGGGGSTAAPANGKGKGKNGLGVQVLSGKAEDNVDGGPGGFVATAVLPQGYGPSPSSLPRDKPLVTGPIGVFESLTGIMHVPSSTQPTSARWIRDSEIPTLNKGQAVASLSDGGGGVSASASSSKDGRIAGGYLAGTRFGSGAWGLASVSTQLEMGRKLEGEGVGFRIVRAAASLDDVPAGEP